jgi:hypothetical protein
MFLAPECYWSLAPGACPDLVDQRGCGRPVVSGGRCWAGWRGRGCVADPGGFKETSDHFHVSFSSYSSGLIFFILVFLSISFLYRAGAAVGATPTANAGGLVAAGGAALSVGAGAVASAASALFGTVSGSGEGASAGDPLPPRDTGARSKRKVLLLIFCSIYLFSNMVFVCRAFSES